MSVEAVIAPDLAETLTATPSPRPTSPEQGEVKTPQHSSDEDVAEDVQALPKEKTEVPHL